MTLAVLVTIALAAAPIVLLISTAGCAQLAGIELPPVQDRAYDESVKSAAVVGYWRLGEAKGVLSSNKQATNSSSNSLHGNYVGDKDNIELEQAGALKKDNNSAALFTGGYVEVPFDVALTPAKLTIELWLKLESASDNSSWRDLVACYAPHPGNDGLIAKGYRVRALTYSDNNGHHLGIECTLGGADQTFPVAVPISVPQEWHYIGFSCVNAVGSGMVCLSVDGQTRTYDQAKKYLLQLSSADGQVLRFGANRDASQTFTGLLDEIAVYGDALSKGDMENHFRLGKTGPANTP
jgi:hypothetical protein